MIVDILEAGEWAVVCLSVLVYLVYRYSVSGYDHFAKQGIPFKKPLPFVGNLWPCITKSKSYVETVTDIYEENRVRGAYFYGIFNLKSACLYVRDPKEAVNILKTDFKTFPHRGIHSDSELDPLSANLFFMDGPGWKTLRQRLLPVFAAENLRAMVPLLRGSALGTVAHLKEECEKGGGSIVLEVNDFFKHYALEVIAICAFGLNSEAYASLKYDFATHVAQTFQLKGLRGIGQFIRFFQPSLAKLLGIRFIPKTTEDFFTGIIRKEMESRRKCPEKNRNDFLQLLMDVKTKLKDEDQPKGLSDTEIAAQAFSFIVAGYDTISIALAFVFYNLARYPDAQKEARSEAVRCLSDHDDPYEAIRNMTYIDMSIKESLRLYPAQGGIMRNCTADYRFSDGGPRVTPDKPIVVVPVQGLHMDPEFHTDPANFTPERFAQEGYPRPGTYMPFGDGQRNCIGKRFALVEMKLLIAHILKDFEVSVDPRTSEPIKMDPVALFAKAKGGIWLRFAKI